MHTNHSYTTNAHTTHILCLGWHQHTLKFGIVIPERKYDTTKFPWPNNTTPKNKRTRKLKKLGYNLKFNKNQFKKGNLIKKHSINIK